MCPNTFTVHFEIFAFRIINLIANVIQTMQPTYCLYTRPLFATLPISDAARRSSAQSAFHRKATATQSEDGCTKKKQANTMTSVAQTRALGAI